jgi:hypothetical protein
MRRVIMKFTDTMHAAYRVADELLKDRLKDQAPEMLSDLEDLQAADVIVTRGAYDFIEQVLAATGTPCTAVGPRTIDGADLRADQIIFVNCPGDFTPKGLRKLANFVNEGGFLFTTDWALKNVLEKAFPGYVQYNQRPTSDEVVRVDLLDQEDPFLKSILGPEDDPQWWLEGASYPITVLDSEKVKVLITSKELGKRYGEPAVFVSFDHGEGKIYHMISHFYLQRTETRTRRHRKTSFDYMKEKGLKQEQFAKYADLGADRVGLGEVESAFTSRGMMSKVMYDKMQQIKKKTKE